MLLPVNFLPYPPTQLCHSLQSTVPLSFSINVSVGCIDVFWLSFALSCITANTHKEKRKRQLISLMGLLKAKGVVYKPVEQVDLGPGSDEAYLKANVKAPRLAGIVVRIFAWFLESRIFGTLLLYILKRNNLIHKGTLLQKAAFSQFTRTVVCQKVPASPGKD